MKDKIIAIIDDKIEQEILLNKTFDTDAWWFYQYEKRCGIKEPFNSYTTRILRKLKDEVQRL